MTLALVRTSSPPFESFPAYSELYVLVLIELQRIVCKKKVGVHLENTGYEKINTLPC